MVTASWPDHLLTLDEWGALPEDTSRQYELVEGVMLVVPRPAPLHQRVMVRLTSQLDAQLPDELTAVADVEVVLDTRHPATVRAPDVVVIRTSRVEQNPARFEAADVLVAVEIVSPGTGRTDRVTKLTEYADAGVPHYWLIELDPPTRLTAYTLVDGDYQHVAGGTGTIVIPAPTAITLDLATLTARR